MAEPARPRALMALQFFPRGGSAHVARNVAHGLAKVGWDVRIASGSVAGHGEARAFYAGLDVVALDMAAALAAPDPVLADPPLHPSYEDRAGAPDRVFASLDDAAFEHQVAAWERVLREAGAAECDVLHLHHLTPIHEAAARVAPGVPVVGHLHGTELLMLEEVEAGAPWPHAKAWTERMRRWAAGCRRIVVLSETQVERARRLLGIDPAVCVQVPNGFDPDAFVPREVDRASFWRRHLVESPQGWDPSGATVGYSEADVAVLDRVPVLLYVGRFTIVKRVPLLVEAFARARETTEAALVLLGGFPGEWEGEHPAEAIARTGARGVFLAGWHGHDELPAFLAASDAVVLASVREQFGQVLVEGMACGRPAIAVAAHGPAEIVDDGATGWLVPPDDRDALTAALVAAAVAPDETRRRGAAAREVALARYSWPALAERVAEVYAAAQAGS